MTVAAILKEQMTEAERVLKALEDQLNTINKLPATLLRQASDGEL